MGRTALLLSGSNPSPSIKSNPFVLPRIQCSFTPPPASSPVLALSHRPTSMLQSCLCVVVVVFLKLLWSYRPFQSFQLSLHCFAPIHRKILFRRNSHTLDSHLFNQPSVFHTHHCTDIVVPPPPTSSALSIL